MKAWLFTGAHKPLELIERPDPVPGPGQVVLDVRGAGLCHSDVGFLDGTLTAMLAKTPMILGHEVAGVVAAIGDGVAGVAPGDRVVSAGPESTRRAGRSMAATPPNVSSWPKVSSNFPIR